MGDCVPVFVPLKPFAETPDQPGLLKFIVQTWQVLNAGRALVLLDGLDEVAEAHGDRILQEIQTFSQQFHACHFVVTCRIAAQDYTFTQFTEVEVAPFDDDQIRTFATQWFASKNLDFTADFLGQLQDNPRIGELATNPLLLTLLCLEFEDSGDFPADRAQLYQRAVTTLLRKWDSKRQIRRQQVYQQLSVPRKEDMFSNQ
ncbi:MAG: NACHT domain-containing protein [Geitlerinemataceae cyanobacterium]